MFLELYLNSSVIAQIIFLQLLTRRQQPGESLHEYLNALKLLAKDCTVLAAILAASPNSVPRT